jgi:lysozyme family protein
MQTNFNTCLSYVLIDEGGNDDDPNDHGGRTSRGITQREYDAWCKLNSKTGGDVWNATQEDVGSIYHNQYWNPYCDSMVSGPDYLFFDISVNAGRTQAVRQFQKALGVNVDGMMGQVTQSAICNADPVDLVHKVSDIRRSFYKNLSQFSRYGKGWLARVDHSEARAVALATNTPHIQVPAPAEKATAPATTAVQPEASGGVAVGAGGLMSILDQFKDTLSNYADTFEYIKYVLIAIAVIGLGYSVYGFTKRSNVQAAQ